MQKDTTLINIQRSRINIKKILSLNDVINKPYSKVVIELKDNCKISEIKEILSDQGDTEVSIVIKDQNKKVYYSLKNNRKFKLSHLKALKAKDYVEKIDV